LTVTVTFLGYQTFGSDYPPVALYNVHGDHRLDGSTVSAQTLEVEGLTVPETPGFEEWKNINQVEGN
jgi:hypothetical protein